MEITKTEMKRCTLLNIAGRVDSGTAPALQSAITEVTEGGTFKLVLDMGEVDFISSAGLWVLVNAQKNCKRFNRGEVILADVQKRIIDALDLAGFIPYFKIFDDAAQAVGHF